MATTTQKKPAAKRASTSRAKHQLAHLVPHAIKHDQYESRLINDYADLDLLHYAAGAKFNVLLFGPTGPGKTSSVFAYGAREKKPVVTVACNGGVDPATFWGQPVREGNRITFQESTVVQVIRHGGILYLDEVNFLHPRMAAVFHGLLDDRRSIVVPELLNEQIEAHPDLFVIAAYNPDYQGTRPLNEAFKNRFKIKLHFDYDREIEEKIVPLFPDVDVAPLLDLAGNLRSMAGEGTLSTPVATNMLQEFVIIGTDLGYDFAVANFVNTFAEDERQAVANVFELNQEQIEDILTATRAIAAE